MIKALATKRNALLLALYGDLRFWYSHFGGPLTASEQAAYIKALTDQGISEDQKPVSPRSWHQMMVTIS